MVVERICSTMGRTDNAAGSALATTFLTLHRSRGDTGPAITTKRRSVGRRHPVYVRLASYITTSLLRRRSPVSVTNLPSSWSRIHQHDVSMPSRLHVGGLVLKSRHRSANYYSTRSPKAGPRQRWPPMRSRRQQLHKIHHGTCQGFPRRPSTASVHIARDWARSRRSLRDGAENPCLPAGTVTASLLGLRPSQAKSGRREMIGLAPIGLVI